MVIAVDFDGTLCQFNYPDIGEPNRDIVDKLKVLSNDGHVLILWTCRRGYQLKQAVEWCNNHGLNFYKVNENTEEAINTFGEDTRKICADIYLDDKNPFGIEGIRSWLYEHTN